MPVSKLLRRGYSTVVAVVCAASIAYAIHVNGETGRAELAAARAHQWEIYARATLAHRRHTAKSLELLVRRYNKLAQSATAKQRTVARDACRGSAGLREGTAEGDGGSRLQDDGDDRDLPGGAVSDSRPERARCECGARTTFHAYHKDELRD